MNVSTTSETSNNLVFTGPLTLEEIKKILSLESSRNEIENRASIGTSNPSRLIYADTPEENFLRQQLLFPESPELSDSFVSEYLTAANSMNNDQTHSEYKSCESSKIMEAVPFKDVSTTKESSFSETKSVEENHSISPVNVNPTSCNEIFSTKNVNDVIQTSSLASSKSIIALKNIAAECSESQLLNNESKAFLMDSDTTMAFNKYEIIENEKQKALEFNLRKSMLSTVKEEESVDIQDELTYPPQNEYQFAFTVKREPFENDNIIVVSDDENDEVVVLTDSDNSIESKPSESLLNESLEKSFGTIKLNRYSKKYDELETKLKNTTISEKRIENDVNVVTPCKESNESINLSSNSVSQLNDTLEEIEMALKYGLNYTMPDDSSENLKIDDTVAKEENVQPALTDVSQEEKNIKHFPSSSTFNSTPRPIVKQKQFDFKIPSRPPFQPKPTGLTNILSPVSLYIKSSTTPPVKRLQKPSKNMSPRWQLKSPNKHFEDRENREADLPRCIYKPSKHKILTSEANVKIPQSVKKHMSQIPVVIKHVEKIRTNDTSTELLNGDCSMSSLSFNSSTASNQDISVLATKIPYNIK